MTIEQLLKAKGLTDQEITDLAPMLSNAKYRQALESELSQVETLRAQVTKNEQDLKEYDEWITGEIGPQQQRLMEEKANLAAEAAAAKARLDAYQKETMRRQAGATTETTTTETKTTADPAKTEIAIDPSKYVDRDTFVAAADRFNDAIADAQDLAEEHRELFGSRLVLKDLREKAKAKRMSVRQYWEQEYKVGEKRKEIETKKQQDWENKIRQEERQKIALEQGSNPSIRPAMPSTHPFVERKKADAGKQPWERNEAELANDRVQKAYKKSVERGELV